MPHFGEIDPTPASTSTGGGRYTRGAAWSGGGVAVAAGGADVVYVEAPRTGTIVAATMLGAGGPGSASVEVWKTTYAGGLPTSSNKISASAPPTISAASKSQDNTLTGWSTSVTVGDLLAFKLLTCSTFTWLACILDIQ